MTKLERYEVYKILTEDPLISKEELKKKLGSLGKGYFSKVSRYRNEFFENYDWFKNSDSKKIKELIDLIEIIWERVIRDKSNMLDIIKKEYIILKERIEEIKEDIRKMESPIEKILYFNSLNLESNWDWRPLKPQVNIGNYRVDFLYYDRIIVECDGKEFHNDMFQKNRTTKEMNYEYERQLYFQEKGYVIMRFTGSQIYKDVNNCLKRIKEKYYNQRS